MSLKNTKTLRKRKENLQPQMPKFKFLKTLIFSRALQKLQNCNFSFFSYLKFVYFSIIKKMTFIVSVKPNETKN